VDAARPPLVADRPDPAGDQPVGLQFGQVQLGEDDHVVATLLLTAGVYAAVMAGVGWLVAYIQSGGMARRDCQDRSIEFWRSLPVPDGAAVGATVLMHLVLLPLLVMALAVPSGLVVALMVVARGFGWSALAGVPWHEVAAVVGPVRCACCWARCWPASGWRRWPC
jgi:hypothetical protein